MKIFKIIYSEDTPCYEIEVEAKNRFEATDKAEEILSETLDYEFDIWNVIEEVKDKKVDE